MPHKAAGFPVFAACQAARVSASAFYAWVAKREQGPRAAEHAQAELVANLRAIHAESGGTYGSPRVSHELRRRGWRVNHKRVERLMAAHGLVGHRPCHRRGLAVAGVGHRPGLPPPARLVDGRAPRRWPGHRCAPGRRGHPRSEQNGIPPSFTPTAAANTPRPPASTSATGWGCANQWAAPAPGLDNAVAVAESFFATLKVELVDRCRYRTRAQARASVFRWIAWYNLHRLHSTNGYLPPLEWEQGHRHDHPLPSTLAA